MIKAEFVNEEVIKVESLPKRVVLNRAIAVGVTILELSKIPMYEFLYKKLKPMFGSRLSLCYMDTDSFIVHIMSNDVWGELAELTNLFDTSNFSKTHPLYSEKNASKLGCFKSETGSNEILAFCGLKSKLYSLLTDNDGKLEHIKKGKGVPKHVIEKNYDFQNYVSCLLENKSERARVHRLTKTDHIVFQRAESKNVMNSFDDKRLLLTCSIHSVPYGYSGDAKCTCID